MYVLFIYIHMHIYVCVSKTIKDNARMIGICIVAYKNALYQYEIS